MPPVRVRPPTQPRPEFIVEECSDSVPDALREQIVKTMMWRAQLALYDTMTPGRSLYALMRFPHDGKTGIVPVKLKGAGGLKSDPQTRGGSLLVPPEPQLQYSPVRQLHFAMGPDYDLGAVTGSEKSKFSCGLAGGANEYRLQQKAHDHDIAMPPLLRGRFDGETDRLGKPTGAVAIAADHNDQTVGRANAFYIGAEEGVDEAYLIMQDHLVRMPIAVMAGIRGSTAEMMGDVKRKALVELGISRHAGHEGNFLLNRQRTRMLIADFDSAKELSELDADVRPYQLLRDVSHDTWRTLSKFAFKFQMHDEALAALADNQNNPMHRFLLGFFGKTAGEAAVTAESQWLTQRFLAFVAANKAAITAQCQDYEGSPGDMEQSVFSKALYPLFADCIISCTRLLQADPDVRARGYVLPDITEADLRAKAERGIAAYFALADAESARGIEKMQREGKQLAEYF